MMQTDFTGSSLMTRAQMALGMLAYSPLSYLTWLIAQEHFIQIFVCILELSHSGILSSIKQSILPEQLITTVPRANGTYIYLAA
jgi:hypothetical protein